KIQARFGLLAKGAVLLERRALLLVALSATGLILLALAWFVFGAKQPNVILGIAALVLLVVARFVGPSNALRRVAASARAAEAAAGFEPVLREDAAALVGFALGSEEAPRGGADANNVVDKRLHSVVTMLSRTGVSDKADEVLDRLRRLLGVQGQHED